jgi:DNA mismatch repair protein MutL
MEAKIQLLSDNIVNKIAAGEVVERPASVVKELVENSIDAGAKRIHVSITAGGKQSISVSDDGHGMTREDLQLSYLRHATSKMHSPSDLFNIQTLGFRGEALASIGAVSFMSIETRHRGESEGTRLIIEGGVEREIQAVGRRIGTTISVRQLFFNTPARRKFLRHVDTESRHITRTVVHLAAAYPEIGFELEHHERNVLRFIPSSPIERALDLLGMGKEDSLQFHIEQDGVLARGTISIPSTCQKTKAKQYLIVRGRPIYARILTDAIYRGYSGLLTEGSHPAFLCWLDLDPRQVDVNVHPTKREIRIANEKSIAETLQSAVRQSISIGEEDGFVFAKAGEASFAYPPPVQGEASGAWAPVNTKEQSWSLARDGEGHKEGVIAGEPVDSRPEEGVQGELLLRTDERSDSAHSISSPLYDQVWQAHEAYLICPLRDALLVVDQQAAHQRVLYEEVSRSLSNSQDEIQQLLFPFVLKLGREEFSLATDILDDLLAMGFDMREFGDNTFVVEGVPVDLGNWNEGFVLRQILNDLHADKAARASGQLREALFVSYARHAAVSEGRALELREMQSIIKRLMQCQEPYVCPRGKPTMVKVLRRDLDKLFGKA